MQYYYFITGTALQFFPTACDTIVQLLASTVFFLTTAIYNEISTRIIAAVLKTISSDFERFKLPGFFII